MAEGVLRADSTLCSNLVAGKGVFKGSLIGIACLKFELVAPPKSRKSSVVGSGKGRQGNNGKPRDGNIDDETDDDASNNFCPRQKGHLLAKECPRPSYRTSSLHQVLLCWRLRSFFINRGFIVINTNIIWML